MLWNCNSIRNKVAALQILIEDHNPLIIILTETHLTPQISTRELQLSDYTVVREDRLSTKGGGILIAVKIIKNLDILNHHSSITTEILAVRLSIFGSTLTLVA